MKTKGMILAILMALILLPSLVSAIGTSSGTTLTNQLEVVYKNEASVAQTPVTDSKDSTVVSVYGYDTNIPSLNNNVSPGGTAWYTIFVTNTGNASDTFRYSVDGYSYDTAPAWGYDIYDTVSGAQLADTVYNTGNIAEDADTYFVLKVGAPGAAGDGEMGTGTIGIMTASTPSGYYTGGNDTVYGGADTRQFVFVTTVGGPVIYADKIVSAVQAPTTAGYSGAATDLVPGGTITYRLRYDNDGSGTATSVVLTDTLPNNAGNPYVSWAANSIDTTNAGVNITSVTVEWYDSSNSDWETIEPPDKADTVSMVRFTLNGTLASNNGDAVGTINATAADVDAGYIEFSVYVK